MAITKEDLQYNGLLDSNSRLKAIIDTAVDGIITIDERGVIESVNPAVLRIFKYEEHELIGNKINILMPEPDRSRHDHYMDSYKSTGIGKIIGKGREVLGKKKDGTTFPFLLSISEVELSDRRIFTGIIHDVSEIKKIQDALKKEMELNELKSRFVTMASHEFRTPLSAILSSVSLISKYNDTKDHDKREKHVNRIKASVNTLTAILNDFLSLSKLEEGKITVNSIDTDIVELSTDVVDEMNSVLKENQIIEYNHYGDETKFLLDKNILKNICINLISNAIKYSDEGKHIEFTTNSTLAKVEITVKDYGIGIPESDKNHLFSRFFRAGNAGNIQGTGLGLNIVKKYVDLLGGSICFISEINKGSTFIVSIPITLTGVPKS